ncbi:MAG: hypothetical protein WCS15_00285 [Prevotella sp.]|nr:hypothetical protein [Massilibacteroides sp.]
MADVEIKYLRDKRDGFIWVYSEALAKKPYMELYSKVKLDEAHIAAKKPPKPRPARSKSKKSKTKTNSKAAE